MTYNYSKRAVFALMLSLSAMPVSLGLGEQAFASTKNQLLETAKLTYHDVAMLQKTKAEIAA
jgi:hypothetical protein